MPTPSTKQPRSTEHHGLGQSGYFAGRVENDPSLRAQAQDRNTLLPRGSDENPADLGVDERFTGTGGPIPELEAED